MKSEAAPLTANVGAASVGIVAASTPEMFYNTPEWLGAIAIGGAIVIFLAVINGIFTLRKNLRYKGKERRKHD